MNIVSRALSFPPWNEADRLAALRAYGVLDTPAEQEFDDICRIAAHTCQAPIALVSLVEDTRQWFKAEVGLGICETPREVSVCAHAILQEDLLIVPDATQDPRFSGNSLVTGELGLRFYAGAPLRTPDGLPLGTICVLDIKPRPEGLDEAQSQILLGLARQVMANLELRRAFKERQAREEMLRASEEFSRSIIESSPDCVKVLDPAGTLQFMNGNGLCAMEIDDFAPFCGQPWKSLWPEESRADIEAALQTARSGGVGRFSAFCPTAKGTPKWWDVIVSPVLDRSGQPERLISVSRDVTELHDARCRLEGEQQRLLQLFEQAPGFMAVLRGPEHVFELANAAYRQIIGHRHVVGKPIRRALPELEGQGYFELFDQVYASGEPFVGRASRAVVQRRPDAPLEEGYFDFILQPIREPNGSISGIFVQGHEVTEQKLAEQELRAANEELQQFAYIVSHDLRAPLVNVMGFTGELDAIQKTLGRELQEAEKGGRPLSRDAQAAIREDLPEAVKFIRSSTGKMDRLIGAILRLSREGQRVLTPQRINMQELIQSYSQSLAHQLEHRGAKLIVEGVPEIVCDRIATEQIFGNLIENAVKYLSPDRPGRITVRGREVGSQVCFEVQDNGRGIEAHDLERIFGLFRRAGSQDQPGEGIGLAHVRALVRRLGGSISVASQVGEGSTFTVKLPKTLSLP